MDIPGLFLFIFGIYQTNITFFQQYNAKIIHPIAVWCWDSNPRPFDHESPPITTRPGLMPGRTFLLFAEVCCGIFECKTLA